MLHHVSYRRVGNERPSDVVPLCDKHHRKTHAIISKGIPLDQAHLYLRGKPG